LQSYYRTAFWGRLKHNAPWVSSDGYSICYFAVVLIKGLDTFCKRYSTMLCSNFLVPQGHLCWRANKVFTKSNHFQRNWWLTHRLHSIHKCLHKYS